MKSPSYAYASVPPRACVVGTYEYASPSCFDAGHEASTSA